MSIAKNYIYNMTYQLVTLFVPLITMPYISRVLGINGIGINAFTNSIIQYFILLGTIGISLYGNREIAYVRDDIDKLSRTFTEIITLQLITTTIAFLLFLIFLIIIGKYQIIFLIQSIYIIAAGIDITWLYMGLEEFKKIVARNLIVKIIGVICIFLFVKDSADLWKYVFVLAFSQFLGNLSLWLYLSRTVTKIKIKRYGLKKHIHSSIILFIPQIAIQIYLVLNKTMLGIQSNTTEVGFFDNADKIVKVVLTIVTAMGTVMLPRISNTFAKGEMDKVKDYLYNSLEFASFLSIPLMFGLSGIAVKFSTVFLGNQFSKSGTLILIISPIILFIAWSNVLGNQYLMPTGKMKGYTVSVAIGAVVNLVLNLFLINRYQSIGTAIATVVAEFSVMFIQFLWIRKDLQIKKMFRFVWKYFISGLAMYIIIRCVGILLNGGIKTIIIQIFSGVLTYFVFLFLLKNDMNKKLFGIGLKVLNFKIINK